MDALCRSQAPWFAAATASTTTASRCAPWPTPCSPPATPPIVSSLTPDQHQLSPPARPARPYFPTSSAALTLPPGRPCQLQHHGPPHAERLLRAGQFRNRAATQLGTTPRSASDTNMCADCICSSPSIRTLPHLHLACRGTNQPAAAPIAAYAQRQASIPPLADSHYDGLHVSYRRSGPSEWGNYRISYTYSKALDDVSEFFFSAPINNFNLRRTTAAPTTISATAWSSRSTVHSSMKARARPPRQVHSTAFMLSGILQYYSALPFNIATGENSIQTRPSPCLPGFVLTPTPPNTCANALPGTMIGRNAASRLQQLHRQRPPRPRLPIGERFHLQTIAEAFNVLNHRNNQIPNGTFGTGTYPTAPSSPTAKHSSSRPRGIQFAARLSF